MLVLFVWPIFFPPAPRMEPPQRAPAGGDVEPGAPGGEEGAQPQREAAEARTPAEFGVPEAVEEVPEAAPTTPRFPDATAMVSIPGKLDARADAAGGVLTDTWLPEFHETVEDEEPYHVLSPLQDVAGIFELKVHDDTNSSHANWKLISPLSDGREGVRFEQTTSQGFAVAKTIEPDSAPAEGVDTPYHLLLKLEFTNTGPTELPLAYDLYGPQGIDSEMEQAPGSDVSLIFATRSAGRLQVETESGELTNKYWERNSVAWVGIASNYFASILVPGLPGESQNGLRAFAKQYPDLSAIKRLAQAAGEPDEMTPVVYERYRESATLNLRVAYHDSRLKVGPGETYVQYFTLFVGPRQTEVLANYDALRFSDVNDYGVFGLVNLFIYLLEKLKTLAFGSWGLAIILLTVIVKLCLHPVNKRSQRSIQRGQKKMQKVKPQMDALKEKYKDNRMKLNQELQKVFREHDVNPAQQLGGCLVIFLQLPIWFALYNTLRYAIGLRQEDFLYITDLTRPDHLFPLGVELPILGSYFNLLPVLYVILTLVNQQLQPKPDDPQMQAQFKMMSFMMVFFGFIFYAFPSGFMLYIMTSSALGIIESKIIKAELAREDSQQGTDGATVTAGPGPGGAPYRASGKLEGKAARHKGKAKGKGKGKGKRS